MSLSRIVRNVRTFLKPSGNRRKGKSQPSAQLAERRNTPPHGTTYEPFTLDMAEVADALMRGLAETGLAVFQSAPPRPVPVRVTATMPAHKEAVHPLARASKRLVRPEDAETLSPAFFRTSTVPGLRVKLSAAVPVQRTASERPVYPPRPTTPPPVPQPRSEAHSALDVPFASTATVLRELEAETQEIYRDAGWDAFFAPVADAETLEMPVFHVCKHCRKPNNGQRLPDRSWECGGCHAIDRY